MRVLLLGPTENEKIPQALRREHILCDRIDAAACDPGALPAGVYDACLLVACAADKGAGAQLAQQLTQLREKGLSLPLLAVCPHLPARDRILVLDAGADDVLSAPFLMGELLARVRAVSRRGPLLQPSLLAAGDLTLDRSTCMLHSRAARSACPARSCSCSSCSCCTPARCCRAPGCSRRYGGWAAPPPTTTSRSIFRSCAAGCAPSVRRRRSMRNAAWDIIWMYSAAHPEQPFGTAPKPL